MHYYITLYRAAFQAASTLWLLCGLLQLFMGFTVRQDETSVQLHVLSVLQPHCDCVTEEAIHHRHHSISSEEESSINPLYTGEHEGENETQSQQESVFNPIYQIDSEDSTCSSNPSPSSSPTTLTRTQIDLPLITPPAPILYRDHTQSNEVTGVTTSTQQSLVTEYASSTQETNNGANI